MYRKSKLKNRVNFTSPQLILLDIQFSKFVPRSHLGIDTFAHLAPQTCHKFSCRPITFEIHTRLSKLVPSSYTILLLSKYTPGSLNLYTLRSCSIPFPHCVACAHHIMQPYHVALLSFTHNGVALDTLGSIWLGAEWDGNRIGPLLSLFGSTRRNWGVPVGIYS